MLHYILQTIAFQLFFLIIYDTFLKRETFFNWNRAYLLITSILSITLPFIKIQSFKDIVPNEYVVNLPQIIIGKLTPLEQTTSIEMIPAETSSSLFTWENIFIFGACFALLIFILKLYKISRLIYKNQKYWNDNLRIVTLLKSNIAFSFFYYVFLGEHIKEQDKPAILKHESIHVNQKHTLDLLLFELLRIVFWFNPLINFYQNRIASLHEFIADAEAVKSQNRAEYYQDLLSQIFETENVSFINTFYKKSLIKKRIVMLGKVKSKQIQLVKYALFIPMVFGMLLYTSSYAQDVQIGKTIQNTEITQEVSDQELKDKYYVEMIELYSNGKIDMILKDSENIRNRYLNTREEYYEFQANMKVMFDKMEHTYNRDKIVLKEKLNRSYLDYLEFKKTDEAKEIWENNTSDGVLRMVVNNLAKYEDEEQKRYDGLKQLMTNDDYFHTLIVSDGFSSLKVEELELLNAKSANENITKETIQDDLEVPFSLIDEVPTSPSCKDLSNNDDRKSCIAREISKHVLENFNVKLAEKLGLEGRQRISVVFKINKEGNVFGVRSRAPHPDLETETIRVINTLPQFIPGKHKGEPVIVPYSLPIIFEVKADQDKELTEIPFSVVEEAPIFPGCENLGSEKDSKKCSTENISKFVQKNFNVKLAGDLGLISKQRISVIFKIDTLGNVVGIRSRAPHPNLEEEAKRVIGLLPKMIPGKQKGKKVIVPYSLPIIFEVKGDNNINNVDGIAFENVDKVPTTKECETLSNNEEQRKCVSDMVSKFVQKNFDADLPSKLGLKGKQRIVVSFEINKMGDIEITKARAPHPDLEAEAIRTIKLLPRFIPGEQNGQKVNVAYVLPIIFMVK